MAADADPNGIVGNVIALVALIGGGIMAAFAAVRALLGAGRDAREAKDLSTKHAEDIHALKVWRGERDERDRNIAGALERIEEALSRLQGHGGRSR